MRTFTFVVRDSEGCWGAVGDMSDTPEEAEKECRRFLAEEVAEGSLKADYTLELEEGCDVCHDR